MEIKNPYLKQLLAEFESKQAPKPKPDARKPSKPAPRKASKPKAKRN